MTLKRDTAFSAGVRNATTSIRPREGVFHLPMLALHLGGELHGVRFAWRLSGNPSRPVVVALGGISAGRYVFVDGDGHAGWLNEIVGPGRALDTDRFCVLGIDYLGGSGASSGPQRGDANFPSLSSFDQAQLLNMLFQHLQIETAHAIVGASYGGMVALAFAQRFPTAVQRIVVISAAAHTHPMSTAWRSVQRSIVRFALEKNDGPSGLKLARALAMATYRTPREFVQRFSGSAEREDGRFRFPVESYLYARGDSYAQQYVPESFVCLSESIDLHQVEPAQIKVPVTLVAVREDQLVPLEDMIALRDALAGKVDFVELTSLYGHDAFLKEAAALRPVFERALESKALEQDR